MINKRWIVNTPSDEEKTLINELSSNLKISETLCSLLVQRGINTYDRITSYNVCYTKLLRLCFLSGNKS